MTIEVRSRRGWSPLRATVAVPVGESDLFHLRGVPPGAEVLIGGHRITADGSGAAAVPLRDEEALRGHLGLIEIRVDGHVVGEIEVEPDKLSERSWRALRDDLHQVWAGLVLDPDGTSRLSAGLPPPEVLWARIESVVHDIVAAPHEVLIEGQAVRRHDRVRRVRELTPSVWRAGARGGAGLARVTVRSAATPENRMVAETLERLRAYAHRSGDGDDVAAAVGMALRSDIFEDRWRAPLAGRSTTWGMRTDHRYRQVHAVHRLLRRPELEPTEGPGELRLGVRGMVRLYEYWVFLRVLQACVRAYGTPLAPGFAPLAVPLRDGRRRLELPPGTTVTFPGRIHVAFEPRITTRGDGWMGLEYVPHPDPARFQRVATPDVVVLRDGPRPQALVVDAKYVGRTWVESAAAATHAKYARMRLGGVTLVERVLIAHPHAGLDVSWAGYGGVPMVPGTALEDLPLPEPSVDGQAPSSDVRSVSSRALASRREVTVLADQRWMRQVLGARRIDVTALAALAADGRPVAALVAVMPAIPALLGFQRMLAQRGWRVRTTSSTDRPSTLAALVAEAERAGRGSQVVLVSGDAIAIQRCAVAVEAAGGQLQVVDDLTSLEGL